MPDDAYPQPPDPLAGRPEFLDDDPPVGMDELPPVEPPSAGFIVQLFVVPAIIVTVIVGVYLLFGQLASGEQDWRKQLTDIRSDNPHVRWRGALGLAQMLQTDASAEGQRLAENRDVARELADLLQESMGKASAGEDDLKQQEFLARTLGLVDVDDLTLPALKEALQPEEDETVRKNALASLAAIANRRHETGATFDDSAVVGDVIAVTFEQQPVLRHTATYTLGLFDSPAADERLAVLLEDTDPKTQFNAAVALARGGSTEGLPVFETVLEEAQSNPQVSGGPLRPDDSGEQNQAFEQALMLSNTLKALEELTGAMSVEQRQRVAEQLAPLADAYPQPQLRIEAGDVLRQLRD
jgi:HEAT repeat protein